MSATDQSNAEADIQDLRWERACASADVTPDEPKAVTIDGHEIGLFRTGEGLFAIDNVCTHEYAYLTKGLVEDGVVECPLHEARFCVKTGACLHGPATRPVATFAVREEDGVVLVGIPHA